MARKSLVLRKKKFSKASKTDDKLLNFPKFIINESKGLFIMPNNKY